MSIFLYHGVQEKMIGHELLPLNELFKLDPQLHATHLKKYKGREENVTIKWLADVNLKDLQAIPPATINYYESLVGKDEPVFNYQFVPHVIYKGSIDVSNSEMIRP